MPPPAARLRSLATRVGGSQAAVRCRAGLRAAGARRPGCSLTAVGQLVADAVDGLQVPGSTRVRLELAPDVFDVSVDSALIGFEGDAVHRVQQLGAGEDATRLARHRRQELE